MFPWHLIRERLESLGWVGKHRAWSNLRPGVEALRGSPSDRTALAALLDELVAHRTEIPISLLFRISDAAERAQSAANEADVRALIKEIWRNIEWELASRCRAT